MSAFPQTVKRLEVSDSFNQLLDFLPSTLTHLTLEHHSINPSLFFLPVLSLSNSAGRANSIIPLLHLEFGAEFNLDIHPLPDGLQLLSFGISFTKRIAYLPPNLRVLKYEHLKTPIPNLPQQLEELRIMCNESDLSLVNSPTTLRKLKIKGFYES